jgi:hypothetical protein
MIGTLADTLLQFIIVGHVFSCLSHAREKDPTASGHAVRLA